MISSFSWTSLSRVPYQALYVFGDPTLAKLNEVKLLCETEFCPTKPIPFCNPAVHTGTAVLLTLTSKTLPNKPKLYLQDEPSTSPGDKPSGETEEATSIHFTMVYKSLSHGTEELTGLMLLLLHVFFNQDLVKLLAVFMNMLTLARDLPTTLQDKWKCSRHKLLTNPPVCPAQSI